MIRVSQAEADDLQIGNTISVLDAFMDLLYDGDWWSIDKIANTLCFKSSRSEGDQILLLVRGRQIFQSTENREDVGKAAEIRPVPNSHNPYNNGLTSVH